MPAQLPTIFLLYLLPIWNVIVLLTVNRKRKFKNIVLLLSLLLNVAGMVLLYSGGVAIDDKTHTRTMRVLVFFIALELFLFIRWSRTLPGSRPPVA